jgi:hypothetical protein
MFGYDRDDLELPLEILLPERIRGAHIGHRKGHFAFGGIGGACERLFQPQPAGAQHGVDSRSPARRWRS